MSKYCDCIHCLRNEIIVNPYDVYQRSFSLKDIHLDFDYRTTAMCRIGCNKYGNKPTCPPNIPGMEYYIDALNEYENVFIIGRKYPYSDGFFSSHWRNYSTNEVHSMLLKKEIELFKEGYIYAKAFIGGSCKICSTDVCGSNICIKPNKGRVPIEATGINVFSLMNEIGLEYQEPPVDYFWRIGLVFY